MQGFKRYRCGSKRTPQRGRNGAGFGLRCVTRRLTYSSNGPAPASSRLSVRLLGLSPPLPTPFHASVCGRHLISTFGGNRDRAIVLVGDEFGRATVRKRGCRCV